MHIAIDVSEACKPQKTGKGQWTYGCTDALLRTPNTFLLLADSPVPAAWKRKRNVRSVIVPKGIRRHIHIMDHVKKEKPDVFVSPTSFLIPALLRGRVPTAIVVHDLIAFRSGQHAIKPRIMEWLLLPYAARFAKWIFCLSTATERDLHFQFPWIPAKKTVVVAAGPSLLRAPKSTPDGKTILCIGTLCPRKNQERLILAYKRLPFTLRKTVRLVLVGGRGWGDRTIVHLAQKTPGVSWKGYASSEICKRLFCTCTVFAFPSLYEGFGLPVLDALQHGIPVLTSKRGSLSEVTGNAALTVDPESVQAITDGLERLLKDAQLRKRLSQKGPKRAAKFSWKHTSKCIVEAVQ